MLLGSCEPATAQAGALDPSFNSGSILKDAAPGTVTALVAMPNGQTLVAGDFTSVAGIGKGRIARLNVDGSVDGSFATGAGADGPVHAMVVDGSGKIVIGGDFSNFDGVARKRIARLTSSGALDTTFDPGTGFDGPVHALGIYRTQIVAGGDFLNYNGAARKRLALVNAAGDPDYHGDFVGGTNGVVRCLRVIADSGVVYAGGDFTMAGTSVRRYFAEYSPSGRFLYPTSIAFNGPVRAIGWKDNYPSVSRLFIGGDFTAVGHVPRGRLACFKISGAASNPSLDTGFDYWLDGTCQAISINSSATRIFAAGDFTMLNGQPKRRFAGMTLTTSGVGGQATETWSVDSGYGASGPDGAVLAMQLTGEGKLVQGGNFSNFGATERSSLVRVHGDDGGMPPAVPFPASANALGTTQVYLTWGARQFVSVYQVERSSDGNTGWASVYSGSATTFIDSGAAPGSTLYYRVSAANSNGSSAYTPVFQATTAAEAWTGSGSVQPSLPEGLVDGTVSAMLRMPDGKIVIAGSFGKVSGVARKYIARLLPDLTLDASFNPGTSANSAITQLQPAPNGGIYIHGSFSSVAGVARSYLARLNEDGSLDSEFDNDFTWTFSSGIRAQSDGKVVVFGSFQTFFDSPRDYIARLNVDGSLDTSFSCTPGWDVEAVAIQPDGKILLSGIFDTINGVEAIDFARVLPDGSVDKTFKGTLSSYGISSMSVLPSGKIYAAGNFTSISGASRKYIARLGSNGEIDGGFDPGTGPGSSSPLAFPQPDGKVVIVGAFTSVTGTPRWKIARLNANGSLDATFNCEAGPGTGTIHSIITLPDSSLLVGGSFTSFGATPTRYLVNLKGDGYSELTQAPVLTGAATSSSAIGLVWNDLEGAFSWKVERSSDGGASWQQIAELGWGSTSFTDTGLATGASQVYRVRASNSSGDSPYSENLVMRTHTAYEQWKVDAGLPPGAPENTDSDRDGMGLLVEYALGLDPKVPQSPAALSPQMVGSFMVAGYIKHRSDITYTVESSEDLVSWGTDDVFQGSGDFPIAWTPMGPDGRKFLRLRVSVK